MPTSATGRADRRSGFTLVELLVVVTIIGLMSGLVVLSLPSGSPSLNAEAARFGARLLRAREEAVLTGRTVEVAVTPEGYSFAQRRGGERRPLTEGPFGPELWEPQTQPALSETGGASSVVFDATGAAEPFELALERDGGRMRVSVDLAGKVQVHAPSS